MAELTPPVFLQAGGETAQISRLAIGAEVLASGVVNSADLLVSAPGGTMTASVAAGQGWVLGSRASQGAYHVVNDAPKTITIASSDPTNPRYDRIVANINDAAYSGALNSFTITVVQGVASSSPVEPALPADSFELARVSVGAAVATISNANILDRRVRYLRRGELTQAVSPTDNALILRGAAAQSADLQQWQNNAGAVLGRVASDGSATFTSLSSTGTLSAIPSGPTQIPVTVRAAASQTADLTQWQDNTGAVLSKVTSAGQIVTTSLISMAFNATSQGAIVRGAPVQTANLQEWQNNATAVLASVTAAGAFTVFNGGAASVQLFQNTVFVVKGTAPSANSGGGLIYVDAAGNLRYRGPTTDTQLAVA